ncbi:unnamed protein product [Penicillium camemberti]|uniref:Str. FM013 n=1 Tax=Penicillium camemberti (strain FM 013) TaxID=1429867 RepID=A0A0G4PW83_PENC3|nr:unnamed protein product [Penicillium camemberti]
MQLWNGPRTYEGCKARDEMTRVTRRSGFRRLSYSKLGTLEKSIPPWNLLFTGFEFLRINTEDSQKKLG